MAIKNSKIQKYTPTWLVNNGKVSPAFRMKLIAKIREGVKKI